MAGVYQIYNTETGKRYIGSSIDVERRLKEHKRNLKSHTLREASRKLGVDKNGIKYALRHKQGYMKKLNCTFVQIDKDEFLRNKVTGEK